MYLILKDNGGISTAILFTILLIIKWELIHPQKRGVNRKREKEKFWKLFCLGGRQKHTLRKEAFACGTRGRRNYTD